MIALFVETWYGLYVPWFEKWVFCCSVLHSSRLLFCAWGGPWIVLSHYLMVASGGLISVQQKRPYPRLQCGYDCQIFHWSIWEKMLLCICCKIRKLVKMDPNTLTAGRGRFGRICVAIDLLCPLIPKIHILGHSHVIKYEGLHLICFACGQYGHKVFDCPSATAMMILLPLGFERFSILPPPLSLLWGSKDSPFQAIDDCTIVSMPETRE